MKTKILFYIDTLKGGGAEKVLTTLVNSMDQTKFDITVQTTFRENVNNRLNAGIKYKYAFAEKNAFTELLFRIEAQSGIFHRLHVRTKAGYDIEAAYLECAPTKVIAASTDKNSKKLAWVHCDLTRISDNTDVFVQKNAPRYAKFDKVVCVCENVRESFTALFGDTYKTAVIYNTVDDGEIIEKSSLPLPADAVKRKFTLAVLGRFASPKNYPRLLKTVKQLTDEGFDFDLWVLGDGEERPQIESTVEEYGLQDTVKLFGFRENPYPFIKNADLLVCSSDYEGFSTFITEGLILGKTAVVTDCSGMRELLGNGEYGIVTENDDDAFTDGLRKILSDRQLTDEYTKKAALRGQSFSKDALVRKTQDFLCEILDN